MQKDEINKSESAQAFLEAFIKIKRAKGLTEGTLHHYRENISHFENWRKISYDNLNQLDMVEYVTMLRDSKLAPTTIELRLHPVKSYLRWVISGGIDGGRLKGQLPNCVIDLEIKKRTRTKPDVYISTELLEQFLQECRTLQQKVYFSIVYDTGGRLSEVLNLKIGDVHRDENGICVELNGKTGYRKNWLHESIPLLMPYINSMTSNTDDYLFNSFLASTGPKSQNRLSEACVSSWCFRIVKRLKSRGVITQSDKLRIHSFRHTKARNLKRLKWSNDEINVWMGWAKNSNMATYYGQAREEDIVHRFLEDTGRVSQDETIEHRVCPVCQCINGSIAKFCGDCGNALRPEFAHKRERANNIKVQAEMHKARQLIKTIRASPFLVEQLGLDNLLNH